MSSVLREGAAAPYSVEVEVTVAPGDTWDPQTVTVGELVVRRTDLTVVTWAATLSGATATKVFLTHALAADGSDVPVGSAGLWVIRPKLTVPGGTIYGDPIATTVATAFAY